MTLSSDGAVKGWIDWGSPINKWPNFSTYSGFCLNKDQIKHDSYSGWSLQKKKWSLTSEYHKLPTHNNFQIRAT